jgi:peptidoglycan/xylan/chitin deacetylase (PgdA/CDA1 family)
MIINKFHNGLKLIFPNLVWGNNVLENEKIIYLTFDDGPTPEITHYVLDLLEKFNAKATFFCIGKNIESNPVLARLILEKGHKIGNHTMNHVNAWNISSKEYYKEFQDCEKIISKLNTKSIGFRPPYGRINWFLYHEIIKYTKVFMWSFISGDYDEKNNPDQIIKSAKQNIKNGSIIIFHDSEKAFPILTKILEPILEHYSQNNFQFKTL